MDDLEIAIDDLRVHRWRAEGHRSWLAFHVNERGIVRDIRVRFLAEHEREIARLERVVAALVG